MQIQILIEQQQTVQSILDRYPPNSYSRIREREKWEPVLRSIEQQINELTVKQAA